MTEKLIELRDKVEFELRDLNSIISRYGKTPYGEGRVYTFEVVLTMIERML